MKNTTWIAIIVIVLVISGVFAWIDHNKYEEIKAKADSVSYYREQAAYNRALYEVAQASVDSIRSEIEAMQPQITYLTKNYYSPVPEKYGIADTDAAWESIIKFGERELQR